LGYFAYKGILKDFIALNYGYNAMYVTRNNTSDMRVQWVTETIIDNVVSIPYMWFLFVPAFLAAVKKLREPQWLLVYAAFFADLAGVFLGGKFHGHYWLQLMPIGVVLTVVGYEQLNARWLKTCAGVLLIVAIAGHLVFTGKQIYKKCITQVPDYDKLTGYYLREHTTSADRIYVQGLHPEIPFHADRMIVWNAETDNILRRLDEPAKKKYELYMKTHKPIYIVVTDRPGWNLLPWFPAFLTANYKLEKPIGPYAVFRRE
jgi:hypothetical protein